MTPPDEGVAAPFLARAVRSTLVPWLLVVLFSFLGQLFLRREMLPGEFGTCNALIGLIGLAVAPALALPTAVRQIGRSDVIPVTEIAVAIWAIIAVPFVFWALHALALTRASLNEITALNVLVGLGGVAGAAFAQSRNLTRWAWLLAGAALVRAVAGGSLASSAPYAEVGLGVLALGSGIVCVPMLRVWENNIAAWKAALAGWKRADLVWLGAAASVGVGDYLFLNADRMFSLTNFGVPDPLNMNYVDRPTFDGYQAAGLLGRGLIWGTQPILALFFLQRAPLGKTTVASLKYFWIYLGVLLAGAIFLTIARQPLAQVFSGRHYQTTAQFLPNFAVAMVPIGLLQAFGVFSLASRRVPECFVIGACGVLYTLPLYLAGIQPVLMLAYMFGGALFSTMAVLFVGVVRWGRRQP